MSAPWAKEGASNNEDKNGQGERGASFSVWSLGGRRGHLKVILSSASCVKD